MDDVAIVLLVWGCVFAYWSKPGSGLDVEALFATACLTLAGLVVVL